MGSKGMRSSLRLNLSANVIMLFWCLLCVLVFQMPATADPKEMQKYSFQIHAQRADTALTIYAQVTGRRLLFRQDVVSAYQASAVVGEFTADEAVEILLENCGLVASMNDMGNMIINVKGAGEPRMNKKNRGIFASLVAMLIGTGGDQQVMAQAGTGASSEISDTLMLEEIVVTARRREESLQDVPVVVTAFDRSTLEAYGISTIEDLSMLVPTLNVVESGSALSPFISSRGISSTASAVNGSTDQSVSLNIDGVPFSSGQAYRFAQLDVQQVEFLKGPQALFFGKNSPAGIIALRTADPTDELYTEFRVSWETESEGYYGHAIVSGPLSDTVGGRLAISYKDAGDGFFENDYPGVQNDKGLQYDETLARGTLTWVATDTLNLRAKLAYADRVGKNPYAGQLLACDETPLLGNAVYSDCELNDSYVMADLIQGGMDPADSQTGLWRAKPYHNYETGLASVELNWELSDIWSLSSVTSFYSQDITVSANANLAGFGGFGRETLDETWTQELRIVGEFDNFNLMAGVFLDDRTWEETTEFYTDAVPGVSNFLAPVNYSWKGDTVSAFAQFGYDFNEKWSISLGTRYTEEEKEFTGKWVGNAAFGDKADVLGQPMSVEESNIGYDDLSSEATLSYSPAEHINMFASYKEGFKSGGYVLSFLDAGGLSPLYLPELPAANDYDEETVDGFEVGIKSNWLNNRLKLNAAAYSYEYQNVQSATIITTGFFSELIIENAAEAENKGLELEFTYLASEALTLFGSVEYLDATWGDYVTTCLSWQLVVDPSGCNIDTTGDGISDSTNRKGLDLMFSPEWSTTLGFNFVHTFNSGLGVMLNTYAAWKDDHTGGGVDDPRMDIDSYWLVNASLGLFASNNAWSLDLIVKNVFDETFPSTNGIQGVGAQEPLVPLVGVRGQPRQYLLQFTYRLGASSI